MVPGARGTLTATGVGDGKRIRQAEVRIERARENVFTVTATSQELSALVGAARMALDAMRSAPEPPLGRVLDALERVLSDFDRARERLDEVPRGGG
jgi:hypothetical protein